jgi:hypothetical protein
MSSQKPTDTDHEVLKLLRWVRENFNIEKPRVVGVKNPDKRWITGDFDHRGWSYCSEEFILDHYRVTQLKENAKH